MADIDLHVVRDELRGYFFTFEPDDRLLRQILDEHPALVGEAEEWGWGDTEVRGKLAGLICEKLTGRRWPTYGEGSRQGIDSDELERSVQTAHERWVAEHDESERM